jgi:hypothetical protein
MKGKFFITSNTDVTKKKKDKTNVKEMQDKQKKNKNEGK